jgi:hypothetical protein
MEALARTQPLNWSVASRAQAGETDSGDRYVVEPCNTGMLVSAIDALGHGTEAARTAEIAAGILRRQVGEAPEELFAQCHAGMRGTRGAAINLAVLDWPRRMMSWLGIGNVTGVLVRADTGRIEPLLVHGGVVGHKLPHLRPSRIPVAPGDVLVLATDGVRGDFTKMLSALTDPRVLAERILEKYASRHDDALVLVFRCSEL